MRTPILDLIPVDNPPVYNDSIHSVFLVQILHENQSDDQDTHDLKWLQLDCLDGLTSLAEGQAWAARQLASVSY